MYLWRFVELVTLNQPMLRPNSDPLKKKRVSFRTVCSYCPDTCRYMIAEICIPSQGEDSILLGHVAALPNLLERPLKAFDVRGGGVQGLTLAGHSALHPSTHKPIDRQITDVHSSIIGRMV